MTRSEINLQAYLVATRALIDENLYSSEVYPLAYGILSQAVKAHLSGGLLSEHPVTLDEIKKWTPELRPRGSDGV